MYTSRGLSVKRPELARRAGRRCLDADSPRQASELRRVLRQRVGLELVEDLEPMLDGAQMNVRSREQPAEVGRQVAPLGEAKDRLQRVRLAQPRVVAAVKELEGLDDELDLADAAAAELDVRRLAALSLDDPVDLRLHVADRRHHLPVEPGAVGGLAGEGPVARA